MNWYLAALKKYVDFDGRARRKEFWMFNLFNILIYFVCIILAVAVDKESISMVSAPLFKGAILARIKGCHDLHDYLRGRGTYSIENF